MLSRVESVTTTSLAKEFVKTCTAILMPPASSRTKYVPFNPIVTTAVERVDEVSLLARVIAWQYKSSFTKS